MLFNDKELRDAILKVDDKINKFHEEYRADLHIAQKNFTQLSQAMVQKQTEIDSLNAVVKDLVDGFNLIEDMLRRKQSPPRESESDDEKLSNYLNRKIKDKKKNDEDEGYCTTCEEDVIMENIAPKLHSAKTGVYKHGKCPKCGDSIFKKVK